MKKPVAFSLAALFGMTLAVLFTPISVTNINADPKVIDELAHDDSALDDSRTDGDGSTWWQCDPLEPNTIFQGMRENVQTSGDQRPESMGYKNCTKDPHN